MHRTGRCAAASSIKEVFVPYYRWKGVDLSSTIQKGVLFAHSQQHLDELLLKRQMALLACSPVRQWFSRSIRMSDTVRFFRQLTVLVDAGVLLPDALSIVCNQLDHPQFQEIVHVLSSQVHEGVSLSDACERYPHVFSPIIIQLIRAGEESGELAQALQAITTHLTDTRDFYMRLRAALALPGITLLFFFVIATVIFVVIMPHLSDVFSSMGQQLPPLTKRLLAISNFVRSFYMLVAVLLGAFFIALIWKITRRARMRRIMDRFLLRVPLFGSLLQQRFLGYTMQSLAVLLRGGMPLVQAIDVVHGSLSNQVFRDQLKCIEEDVASGNALSSALLRHPSGVFSQDVIAMVEVGEESGRLSMLLAKVGQSYHDRVAQRLSWLTILLQPAIMIFMGILVGLLIFAVYGPIFTLSGAF